MAAKRKLFFLTNNPIALSSACLVAATSPSSACARSRTTSSRRRRLTPKLLRIYILVAYLGLQSGCSTWQIVEEQMPHSVHVHHQTAGSSIMTGSDLSENQTKLTMAGVKLANLEVIDGLLGECQCCFSPCIRLQGSKW